ncbi:MAG: flagellar biosynthetic protein FliQ [Actinomycetota bacterium]
MSPAAAIDIATDTLVLMAKVAAPFLLVVLGVGLFVGLLQSVTQIQEPTLAFVPKLIGAAVVVAVAGPWMIEELIGFGNELMAKAPQLLQS